MYKYCSNCQTPLSPNARECPDCGRALGASGYNLLVVLIAVGVGSILFLGIAAMGVYALWVRRPVPAYMYMEYDREGDAALSRRDFNVAIADYSLMIAMHPRNYYGYLERANCEEMAGRYFPAVHDNTAGLAVTHNPIALGDLYLARADDWYDLNNWNKTISNGTLAVQEYIQVTSRQDLPDVPERIGEALEGRADAYFMAKNYRAAIEDYTVIIDRLYPRPQEYGMRAKSEAALGQNPAAWQDFVTAVRMDDNYADGYRGLEGLVDTNHRYKDALPLFLRGSRANPNDLFLWGSLCWYQYSVGQYAAAIDSGLHVQALDSTQAWNNYNLALSYAAAGHGVQAKAAYAFALEKGSQDDRKSALSDLHHALLHHPNSATLRLALAQVNQGTAGAGLHTPLLTPISPILQAAPPVDPLFASALAPDIALNDFGIRPPAGYKLEKTSDLSTDEDDTKDAWRMPVRDDGTEADVVVFISNDNGNRISDYTLKQLEQNFLDDVGSSHTKFSASSPAPCTIAGRDFVRATWSGVWPDNGRREDGIVYIADNDQKYIEISVHDYVPYCHSTLPILDASAQTFRSL